MDIGATIGARIAFFRNLVGWNQKRLALEMGMDPSRICRIENGRARPLFEEIEKMGLLLGQPLAHFDTKRPVQFSVAVAVMGARPEP